MGILENRSEMNAAFERFEKRGKDRDFAAISVCYALRHYNEQASTGNWHRVSEKLRAFDAAEVAYDAAAGALHKLQREWRPDDA